MIIQTQHGCVDDVILNSALVVNDFEIAIDTLDSNLCFNGAESITKDFEVLISPTYDLPYEILSHQWTISPDIAVQELNNTESALSLEFENTGTYTTVGLAKDLNDSLTVYAETEMADNDGSAVDTQKWSIGTKFSF